MKNLFFSLCLLIGFSTTAQATDFQTRDSKLSQNMFIKATSFVSSILFNNNIEEIEIEETDEAFDFDIINYLPANFNAFTGLFDVFDTTSAEEDAPFDFDTAAYLPVGFNANIEYDIAYDLIALEEDEEFDFDTKAYLPVGFNANINLDAICEITVEEDVPFNFNTNDYLPVGFSANGTSIYDSIEEIAIEEEDAPFDFDTMAYLPADFHSKESSVAVSNIYILDCITFPSI